MKSSVKVVIGTTNPAKREAVAVVVNKLWPRNELVAMSVPSGVSAQPFDVHETVRSALELPHLHLLLQLPYLEVPLGP